MGRASVESWRQVRRRDRGEGSWGLVVVWRREGEGDVEGVGEI